MMEQKIRSLAFRIHHAIPPGMRNVYRFMIVFIRKIGTYLMPVTHFIFTERETGEKMSMIHIGWDKRLSSYWLNRFSDHQYAARARKKIAVWNIKRFLDKSRDRADLALIETRKDAGQELYPDGFLLSRWMEMELDIETSLKKSRTKHTKRDIRKHSLRCEIREGMDAFDLFYFDMYRPLVQKRHGDSADISDYRHFSRKYRTEKCKLFFIIKNHEPLACAFIEEKQKGRLSALGIKDGDNKIFRMGVIGALYYYVMLYYYEQGSKSILLGNSMPVVIDGVTEFKMLIGAEPYRKDLPGEEKFFFLPLNTRHVTLTVMKSNPLFHLSKGKLCISFFADDKDFENRTEFIRFIHRLRTEKVDRTTIYHTQPIEQIMEWIRDEGLDNIEYTLVQKGFKSIRSL